MRKRNKFSQKSSTRGMRLADILAFCVLTRQLSGQKCMMVKTGGLVFAKTSPVASSTVREAQS